MTTGEKIAACRKNKKLSQEQLAGALGVTRQAVSRWESDLAFPETDTLVKMSRMFGVSCDYLLNYNEVADESPEEKGKAVFSLNNLYFEYKSNAHIGSLPLVHINIGLGRVAKGFFSVGLVSVGVVSFGLVSLGALAFGIISLGLLSFASLSFGIVAFGGAALGVIAFGGLAVGVFSVGGAAIGAFALGGYACGGYIAVGDIAVGKIALGKSSAEGSVLSVLKTEYEIMKTVLYAERDKIPDFWAGFTAIFKSVIKTFAGA